VIHQGLSVLATE